MPEIAIVFALCEEVRPLLRECPVESETLKKPAVLTRTHFRGVPLLLCRTGVGMANAHEGAELLLEHAKPSLILSVGCAGAIDPELKPGELVLASEILSETPTDRFKTDEKARALLEGLIREERISYRTGPLITVWKLAGCDAKEALFGKGPIALDMETAAVVAIAEKAKVPFVSLRAVFDPADEELPCSEPFDAERSIRFLAKNPKMILKAPKYAWWSSLCQRNLFKVLSRFVHVH